MKYNVWSCVIVQFSGFLHIFIKRSCWEPSRVDVVGLDVPAQGSHSQSGRTGYSPQWLQKLASIASAQPAAVHGALGLSGRTRRASRFQAGSAGAPLWMTRPSCSPNGDSFLQLGQNHAHEGVRWTSCFSAQAVATLLFLLPGSEGSPALSDHPPGALA